ncbi:MAG: sulfite oxidase-like oxidoreductase [Thermoplasmatota archaeon]
MTRPDQTRYPPERVPPGQFITEKFPVLHAGSVPPFDRRTWDFRVHGHVERPLRFTYDELRALPASRVLCDIHCVTTWSKLDTQWEGVRTSHILELARPKPGAKFVVAEAEEGFTANVLMDDLASPEALLAWGFGGRDLEPNHGFPLRLMLPQRYFWKSAKWVRALKITTEDEPGFWEVRGYHNNADFWNEERYGVGGREPLVEPTTGPSKRRSEIGTT